MPVKWSSKRQKTVETSSYGSELVAARLAVETVLELRYKLRMLGIPLSGASGVVVPTTMYGDNMSVILNTTVPSSQLKKKHNAIAYHRVREAIAAGIVIFRHISTKINFADVLTKPLTTDQFQRAVQPVLFRHKTSMYEITSSTQPGDSELGGGYKKTSDEVDIEEGKIGKGEGKISEDGKISEEGKISGCKISEGSEGKVPTRAQGENSTDELGKISECGKISERKISTNDKGKVGVGSDNSEQQRTIRSEGSRSRKTDQSRSRNTDQSK
jgi:hypothetical protein